MMQAMYNLAALKNRLVGGLFRRLNSDEKGQGMVEYAFIIVLIALIVIVVIVVIGNQTRNMWKDITVQFH